MQLSSTNSSAIASASVGAGSGSSSAAEIAKLIQAGTETRQAIGPTGGNALLETVSVLGDNQLAGAQLQRPLTHHDVALENLHFLDVVVRQERGYLDSFFYMLEIFLARYEMAGCAERRN